jgi:hypothetical protein
VTVSPPTTLDTTRTLNIKRARFRLFFGLFGCLLWILIGIQIVRVEGGLLQAVGAVLVICFAASVARIAQLAATHFGPVITLSPSGFRDTRIAPEVMPWSSIIGISAWVAADPQTVSLGAPSEAMPASHTAGKPLIALTLTAETLNDLTLSRSAHKYAIRYPNVVFISTYDLKVRKKALLRMLTAYWQAARVAPR